MLRRVFSVDVSSCPRCGRGLEIVIVVLDPAQIRRYLRHVGMPAAPPVRAGFKIRVVWEDWR